MLLDHPSDGPAAIRTQFGAIFVSLELSRSNWLVTSLSPGKGEKMSKHSVTAGDTAELMKLFAELKRKQPATIRVFRTFGASRLRRAGKPPAIRA
jgi:transposase